MIDAVLRRTSSDIPGDEQNVDVGEIHRSAADAAMRYVVLLDQSRPPIDTEAGETATLTECNELERCGASPPACGRVFDEPAHGRPVPCRPLFEGVEELFVDRDRRSQSR